MIKLFYYFIHLKKIFAILFLLLCSQYIITKDSTKNLNFSKNTLYFGQFQDIPFINFCVFYNGELINVHDATFVIKDNLLLNINFLFVDPEKIKFITEENTVLNLKLETKNYKFYQLSLVQKESSEYKDGYAGSWNIVEQLIVDSIPNNTVLIPLNPINLEIKLHSSTYKPNNLVINLPKIKLTSKSDQSLKDLITEGYLKTLVLKPFHTKQQIKFNTQNTTKMSIII